MSASALAPAILFILSFDFLGAQNIVESTAANLTANPAKLTETEVSEFIFRAPALGGPSSSAEALRIRAKLEAHVAQFLAGFPFKPFHHTLGISGSETYFVHPDEMFSALALAVPFFSPATATRTKDFLAGQLSQLPPYAENGFELSLGRARESYEVPAGLRARGRSKAKSGLGVYAFWAYCHYASATNSIRPHWGPLLQRARPLLDSPAAFDIHRPHAKDEAEKLNGDLGGLIALARLARVIGEAQVERQATLRAAELMGLRVNLDRVNPHFLEKTAAATKALHNFKLARYCDLTPEVGLALSKLTEGVAAARLKPFREARNSWYLAFGDRLVGGENYTNPLHFSRALFAGAALIEQLPASELLNFLDVPWCQGDFYFIEKCALALWAESGRRWEKL